MAPSSDAPAPSGRAAAYIRWLLRHRSLVLVAVLIATGAAALSAVRIRMRFSEADFYDYPGNPAVPLLKRYYKDFGDPGGFVVVLIEAPDVFRRPVLDYVERLTRELEPDATFSHVRSLATAKVVYGDATGVATGQFMPALPGTPEESERLRRVALGSELLARRLVSMDSTTTVIVTDMSGPEALREMGRSARAIDAVRAHVEKIPRPPGVRARVTGAPVLEVEATRLLLLDQRLFVPLATLLILLAAYVTLHTLHGIALLLSAIFVALVWTAGVFPLFGRPVDMVCSTIPATLLVYGAVDPIFVLTRFVSKLQLGRGREQAIEESFTELMLPCFLTSLTTALGFYSFATMRLPTLVTYGKITALGVSFAFVTTVTVLPLLLSWLPVPRASASAQRVDRWIEGRIAALWGALRRRKGVVASAAAALIVVGGLLALRQTISVYYVGNLPPGETVEAIRVLERKLSGVTRTVVLLEGEPGSMKRPEVLRAIAAIDQRAERDPTVTTSLSLADLVKEVNVAFMGGDAAERRIPTSRSLIAQYLAILDPEDRADFVNDDYSATHIRILSEDHGSAPWRELDAQLRQVVQRECEGLGLRASITGFAPTFFPVLDRLVIELLLGFVLGFSIIVLFQLLIFRSWRIAALSIVPNLIPAIACFVLLSLLGITLRLGTVLFLSVSIGGLFNTTIHFAARSLQRLQEGARDFDEVVEHSLVKVGPPSLFTAVILSLGFAIFLLSRFPDLKVFGILSMTVLGVGFLSDLIVTPVLLRLFFDWERAAARAGGGATDGGSGAACATGTTSTRSTS